MQSIPRAGTIDIRNQSDKKIVGSSEAIEKHRTEEFQSNLSNTEKSLDSASKDSA